MDLEVHNGIPLLSIIVADVEIGRPLEGTTLYVCMCKGWA
jgi:hypothetical protein